MDISCNTLLKKTPLFSLSHTHTNTLHMHAGLHTHMHVHTHAHTHACTHTCTHTDTHTQTHTHRHTHTHTHTYTHTPTVLPFHSDILLHNSPGMLNEYGLLK